MATPREIHARYRARVDRINNRRNMADTTRRGLIAEAWVDARNQMRAAHQTHLDAQEKPPTGRPASDAPASMSDIIRAAAGRTTPDRERMRAAMVYSIATPPELSGLQAHEIERLARDHALGDTPEGTP